MPMTSNLDFGFWILDFGFRQSILHMLGIGISLMITVEGIGLCAEFNSFTASHLILKIFSMTYLLYLSFKIATASPPTIQQLTSLQAALFQSMNPKVWTMKLTANTVYVPSQNEQAIAQVTAFFSLISLSCLSVLAATEI